MKIVNSEKMKVDRRTSESDEKKNRIIVIADKLVFRSELSRLIIENSDLNVCAVAENVDEVQEAFKDKQIDFAVVCSFKGDEKSYQMVNQIKFGCPNLPVLIFSLPMKLFYDEHSLQKKSKGAIDKKAAAQIIESVEYVENLLENNISGFAILVNIE